MRIRRRTFLQSALSPMLPTLAPIVGAKAAVAPLDWQVPEGLALSAASGSSTVLATNVPAGAFAYSSPDLLPGQSLAIEGSTLVLHSEADAPAAERARPTVITVLDSELATAQNMRTGQTYGYTQSGARRNIQRAVAEAADGDTIQISPGAIWSPGARDGSAYLEAGMLHVWKSLTITNIPGRGRWRLAPSTAPYVDGWSGLVIREPAQTYSNPGDTRRDNPRKTIVIEGFDFDNWGRRAGDYGVRIRSGSGSGWDSMHASITFRNFKLGKLPYHQSASGFGGAAENLSFEDGHVFDTGGGIQSGAGQDHNFYVSARHLAFRGVRASRTRGAAASAMDGHILKIAAVNTLIEGCVIDCGPLGDSSYNLQCRAGGNLVIRGCLLIGGVHTQNEGTGVIGYENEATQTPWYYGAEGHSVLIERNVIINHYGKPLLYFRPAGHAWQVQPVSSVVVRDNIGMCAAAPTKITGFGEAMWIRNEPTGGPAWASRNSVMRYGTDEPGFSGKALLRYTRSAGPIAASGGTLSTLRFVFPHGHEQRTDSYRGLG